MAVNAVVEAQQAIIASVSGSAAGSAQTSGNIYIKGDKGDPGPQGPPGIQGPQGIQGPAGQDGQDGQDGTSAGFGTPSATVDGNVGTPGVTITASGPDTAKVFAFAFTNLKGQTGATGETGQQGPPGQDGQNGVGVPASGTTGQILVKKSNTDYDTEWADQSGGTVQSVNNVTPDQNGNITLTADDIGTDETGVSVQDMIDGYVHVGTSAPTDASVKLWLDTDEPGMSAVSSVNGKTGTVVIDDIPMTLLWTNASNMSTFAAQTIAIDLSDYDFVLLFYRMANTAANHGVLSTIYPVSAGDCSLFGGYNANTTGMRPFVISQTGLAFSNGTYGGNGNNDILIPYSIYGIKLS